MFLVFLLVFGMLAIPVSANSIVVSRCESSQHDKSFKPFDFAELSDFYLVLFGFCTEINQYQLRVLCYYPHSLIGTLIAIM